MTPPQYMAALARANEVRDARTRVKQDLRTGRTTLADAMGKECVQSMTVEALLCSQRRWGSGRVQRLLHNLACLDTPVVISENRRVGTLTDREREALLQACVEVRG